MAEKITGSFTIETDADCLKAELVYSFDPAGEAWNEEKIRKIIENNNIKQGFSSKLYKEALRAVLKEPDKSGKYIIAEGKAPIESKPESVEWEDMDLPEDLAETAESVINKAEVPELYQTKIEEIKKIFVEKVKSKLPFVPDKEKKVETIEKKETSERVYVDPQLVNKAWVNEEVLLGELIPSEQGSAGTSIYGKTVQPKEFKDTAFYIGEGIEKRKSALYSKYPGFLRIGKNWTDIIPFRKVAWDLYLSKDQSTCFLDFYPGEKEIPPPSAEEILEKAKELGIDSETLMEAEPLDKIIQEHSDAKKSIVQYSISKDKDAFFEIKIKNNDLKAVLNIQKGRGNGKPLVLKDLGQDINSRAFKGLDIKRIQSDILIFHKSEEQELIDYVLAEGKAPTVGKDQEYNLLLDYLSEKESNKIKEGFKDIPSEALEIIKSLEDFPLEKVENLAYIKRDQPVIEILPLEKGENGVDVFGKVLEGKTGKEFSYEIYENLKVEKNVIVSLADGILENYEENGKQYFRVRFHKDAELEIFVGHDKMSARIEFSRELGSGRALDFETVMAEIKGKSIVKGVDEELLVQKLESYNSGEEVGGFIFAQGKEPVNSAEAKINFFINMASGKGVSIRKDGTADYKNQDKLTTVQKGQKLAELVLSDVIAENGWDLFGKELQAKNLPSVPIEIGKNIIQDKEDEHRIVLSAECEGQLFYDKKSIYVDNQLNIKTNIGLPTGNIKFPGTVNIKGSVESGFKVISGGDVRIGENLEASLVSADGSVEITNGIKGFGKAVVRAKENIRIGFAEQAHLLAVGDINAKNFCLRCDIKCNGKLILSGEKGNLVGGRVKARLGLSLNNIGAESGMKTEISFGQDYLVEDQIHVEEKEIKKLNEQILKIDKYIKLMEHQNKKNEIVKTGQEKVKVLKIMEKRGMRLFTLRERFEEHFKSEIIVSGTVYPGTIIESHGRTYEFSKLQKNITIYFDEKIGHIQTRPNSDRPL